MAKRSPSHRVLAQVEFKPKDFSSLRGLQGISDDLIEAHLKLYEGYVKNTNLLLSRRARHRPSTPEWAELVRRLGFEINGMRLHELYFGNLSPDGGEPSRTVRGAMERAWGSRGKWEEEFRAMGEMRGVGWTILYEDPENGHLSNHWIGLHQDGHPVGFAPILVMDLWEHAFTGLERSEYVDAFFKGIDWREVEARLGKKRSQR